MEISKIDEDLADSAKERDAATDDRPRRGGTAIAVLSLLVALAALLATGWMWWQGQAAATGEEAWAKSEVARLESSDTRMSAQLQELREALDSRPVGISADQVAALQARLAEDQAQLAALQQAAKEQVTLERSLQSAIDSMHGRLLAAEAALANTAASKLDAPAELDLAEVDYLLRLASERLQLFSDPLSADRALALADTHLAALGNPAYQGVRKAIAAARNDLAALDMPDELAIAAQLDGIQKAIPTLPFRTASPGQTNAAEAAEAGWWEKLKATLSSLVTVRRSTAEEDLRISLQDKDYLRQRVSLQVEAANLALMRHDQEAFHAALQRVRTSVAESFDPASGEVAAVDRALSALLDLDLAIEWPDISAPWTTLQLVRTTQASVHPIAPEQAPPEDGGDQPE
jgi:uroporphyrin-3 C-methyltransferase